MSLFIWSEDASRQAMDNGLVVHNADPLNAEISINDLIGGVVMPNAKFYIRNHFQIPKLDLATWRLSVGGLVHRRLSLPWCDVASMPSETMTVTLECAGNGRSSLQPKTSGEQWNLGAVSTAEWTGVPLTEVLDRAGMTTEGRHVIFRGADCGSVDGHTEAVAFERSLTTQEARNSGALLAYAMNGEALPHAHGFPLRLIVPGWYAVASVKWLTSIEVVDRPFTGHYQTESYYFERESGRQTERHPLSLQRVRSLITEPADEANFDCGEIAIRGVAWSGTGTIARVELSLNDSPWQEVRMLGDPNPHCWQRWECIVTVEQRGVCVIRARATDTMGQTQPECPEWNRLGYANNAIHRVAITVR